MVVIETETRLAIGNRRNNMIGILDVVIVATALVAAYLGWRVGMVRVGMGLVGLGGGIVLAGYSATQVTPYMAEYVSEPDLAYAFSFLVVALATAAVAIFVGGLLRRFLKLIFLGWLDGTAGAALGMALMVGVWSVGLPSAGPAINEEFIESIDETPVAGTILREAPRLLDLAPDFVDEAADGLGISLAFLD